MADGDRRTGMHQQHGHRLANDIRTADHHGFLAFGIDARLLEELHRPVWRTGDKAGHPLHQRTNVLGAEAIDILLGGDCVQHRVGVEMLWQGQLHQNTVNLRIGVEFGDFCQDFSRRRIGGEHMFFRIKPGLSAGIDLVAHIDLRRGIFAHEDHGEPRTYALSGQFLGLLFEASTKFLRERVTVEKVSSHVVFRNGLNGYRLEPEEKSPQVYRRRISVRKPPTIRPPKRKSPLNTGLSGEPRRIADAVSDNQARS